MPGGLVRKQVFTYLHDSNTAYRDKNIVNRISNSQTQDSAAAKVAETITTYDSTALASVIGVTQHDDANFGAGYTTRGNPTVVQQWVSGTTYLTTTSSYDTTGQVTSVTDPAGNNTSYGYSDSLFTDANPPSNPPAAYTPPAPTNAYRTQVTLPITGSQSFGYYFGTGKLASSTDQNGSATYRHYLDPLNRPTHTYTPAGGWRLTQYTSATQQDVYTGLTDTVPSITCTGCRHDQVTRDGLGRVASTALASDPEGATSVATGYDSSGRAVSRSNPYRSVSDPTYGLETLGYDALNRPTSTTHADSNVARTYYGAAVTGGGGIASQLCASATYGLGFPTLLVDETGKKRQSWTDALGRTIEADEPDSTGSLTLGTCYKYDLLGNLTQVVQGSQTRTYAYDGLSRKTSETTPEAGTTNYFYTNAAGGLCAGSARALCRRSDARAVTTTYTYDAETRLTSKTYSDTTPAASFFYDESSVTVGGMAYSLTNTKGRLSHTSASGGTALTLHSYDAAGHTQDLRQCTPFNCSSATIWNTHYTYNLAGDVTTWTHPGGFTISQAVSNARRITQITSSLNDATHPGTLATLTYAPQGVPSSMVNGCSGTGCTQRQETYDYNNRLQRVRIELGTSASPAANSCLVYNYYSGVSNPTSCAIPSQAASGNNRNVMGHLFQDSTNPALGHTASWTYDPMNRLASSIATGSATHNLTFSYDRYGNSRAASRKRHDLRV